MLQKRFILYLIIPLLFIVTFSCSNESLTDNTDNTEEISEPEFEYGIQLDSFIVIKDQIKKNQTLAEILLSYHIPYPTIDLLVKRSKEIFDIRKIRSGNNYTVLCNNDSIQKAAYFVYENNNVDYVVFDLGDSVHVHRGQKEVEIFIKSTGGVISNSLWSTLAQNNDNPMIAIYLSEVYAWTIDFMGIQKNDKYKVIYEELEVNGQSVGIGNIIAAWFEHAGVPYYAIYFEQDEKPDYFNTKAESLRRAFLKAPLKYSRISSKYSNARLHPVLKIYKPHHGVDYAAPIGTPVYSVGDGVVTYVGNKGANGNLVKIKHNGTYQTAYLHLQKFAKGIKQGVRVTQGQIIGYVGSTGRSTGPHLDFRFYKNNKPVNPLTVEIPAAEPIKKENITSFNKTSELWVNKLDSIQLN